MPSYNLPKEVMQLVNDAISTPEFDVNSFTARGDLYRHTEKLWPYMGQRARSNRIDAAMRHLKQLDLEAIRKARGII